MFPLDTSLFSYLLRIFSAIIFTIMLSNRPATALVLTLPCSGRLTTKSVLIALDLHATQNRRVLLGSEGTSMGGFVRYSFSF